MKWLYTDKIPSPEHLFELYESVRWNDFLQLSSDRLHQALVQSWYVISVYDQEKLIGTGRVVSDGVINAYICGLAVHPHYQNQGIGSKMFRKLVDKCREQNLHTQLFCTDKMISYYKRLGFEVFATGMKDDGR